MAKPSNRSRIEQLVDKFEPEVRDAFLMAYDNIRSRVTLKALVERLERGDVEGAIELLGVERVAFGNLDLAVANVFNNGGMALASDLYLPDPSGRRVQLQFGVRNLVAEGRLRDYSAELVKRETDQTKALIRTALTEGLVRGDNPTRSALDMVGRVSRVTGERVGGYLGLSGPQERTQAKARQALISGDVEGMRAYLQLKQRDKRFDAAIIKAIESGKPLARADVDRVVGRLNDRQLKYRADVIGLHETFGALSMARDEGIRQAIESGKVDPRFVVKKWRHSGKEHPRVQHLAMNGKEVPYDQPFIMADGTAIDYPHAPGIPARHSIGCGCFHEIRVDYTGMLIERRSMALA